MIVSRRYIMDNRTNKGSWTRPQIEALGIDWPPRKGWIDTVSGQYINEHQQRLFQSKIGVKAYRKHLKEDPWEQSKLVAIEKYEANKQLDRELIVKQRELL